LLYGLARRHLFENKFNLKFIAFIDKMERTVDQTYSSGEIHDFIVQYADGPIEIEYKILIDVKMFIALLNSFRHIEPTLEQTTNALYKVRTGVENERINYIVSKNYSTSKLGKYIKRRLLDAAVSDFSNIKMSASTERPVDGKPSGSNEVELYRIKNRISFICGEWRYDFTQSLQLSPKDKFFNDKTVQLSAKNMFGNMAKLTNGELIDAYIVSCDNPIIRGFELEVELIAPLKPAHLGTHSFLDCLGDNRVFVKERLYWNLVLSSITKAIMPGLRGQLSLKRILNNSETLTKTMYNKLFPPIGYYISRKADGERALLALMESGVVFTITDKLEQMNKFDYEHNGGSFIPVTILEGELILGKQNVFLAYDIIMANGNITVDSTYADRYPIAAECCKQFTGLPVDVLPKDIFVITEDIHTSLKHVAEQKFPYPDDGYIMTEASKNYFNTSCYKIKEHNTIDFLAIELPAQSHMKLPLDNRAKDHDVFLLFCGSSTATLETMRITQLPFYSRLFRENSFKSDRVPVHFSPPDDPYAFIWYVNKKDSKVLKDTIAKQDKYRPWVIVELERVGESWKMERIRHDRYNEPHYYGNDLTRVALHNWEASRNPLHISEMHMSVVNYFKTGKDEYYHAQTSAMSFVKYHIFALLFSMSGKRSIDFAFGKGQDFNKYIHHKVTHLLGIDIDRVALSEALSRYYEAINKRNSNVSMSITIMQQDLTAKHEVINARIRELWANQDGSFTSPDTLICNLAIHYFTKTLDEMMNFASLLKSLMPSGSMFMYTTFDGEKVFKLLAENGGEWLAQVNGSVKYRIIRKYVNEVFSEYGQTIQVKLPFTNDELYEENLVNVANLNMILRQMGMEVVESGSFADMFELLKSEQAPIWRKLTEDDKRFIGLYQYSILRMK
jgi:hypothetical protein